MPAALAGPRLQQHLMAMLDHLAGCGRGESDPVLVRLDLGGNANNHANLRLTAYKPMIVLAS
jgi:hypothetical protein